MGVKIVQWPDTKPETIALGKKLLAGIRGASGRKYGSYGGQIVIARKTATSRAVIVLPTTYKTWFIHARYKEVIYNTFDSARILNFGLPYNPIGGSSDIQLIDEDDPAASGLTDAHRVLGGYGEPYLSDTYNTYTSQSSNDSTFATINENIASFASEGEEFLAEIKESVEGYATSSNSYWDTLLAHIPDDESREDILNAMLPTLSMFPTYEGSTIFQGDVNISGVVDVSRGFPLWIAAAPKWTRQKPNGEWVSMYMVTNPQYLQNVDPVQQSERIFPGYIQQPSNLYEGDDVGNVGGISDVYGVTVYMGRYYHYVRNSWFIVRTEDAMNTRRIPGRVQNLPVSVSEPGGNTAARGEHPDVVNFYVNGSVTDSDYRYRVISHPAEHLDLVLPDDNTLFNWETLWELYGDGTTTWPSDRSTTDGILFPFDSISQHIDYVPNSVGVALLRLTITRTPNGDGTFIYEGSVLYSFRHNQGGNAEDSNDGGVELIYTGKISAMCRIPVFQKFWLPDELQSSNYIGDLFFNAFVVEYGRYQPYVQILAQKSYRDTISGSRDYSSIYSTEIAFMTGSTQDNREHYYCWTVYETIHTRNTDQYENPDPNINNDIFDTVVTNTRTLLESKQHTISWDGGDTLSVVNSVEMVNYTYVCTGADYIHERDQDTYNSGLTGKWTSATIATLSLATPSYSWSYKPSSDTQQTAYSVTGVNLVWQCNADLSHSFNELVTSSWVNSGAPDAYMMEVSMPSPKFTAGVVKEPSNYPYQTSGLGLKRLFTRIGADIYQEADGVIYKNNDVVRTMPTSAELELPESVANNGFALTGYSRYVQPAEPSLTSVFEMDKYASTSWSVTATAQNKSYSYERFNPNLGDSGEFQLFSNGVYDDYNQPAYSIVFSVPLCAIVANSDYNYFSLGLLPAQIPFCHMEENSTDWRGLQYLDFQFRPPFLDMPIVNQSGPFAGDYTQASWEHINITADREPAFWPRGIFNHGQGIINGSQFAQYGIYSDDPIFDATNGSGSAWSITGHTGVLFKEKEGYAAFIHSTTTNAEPGSVEEPSAFPKIFHNEFMNSHFFISADTGKPPATQDELIGDLAYAKYEPYKGVFLNRNIPEDEQ
jgi:hypothetical protein